MCGLKIDFVVVACFLFFVSFVSGRFCDGHWLDRQDIA